ncbi:MAG: T9SS type A sorting domain-containing protein [Fibrobacteres bacterium]|nr:T9SS type A sorting domain-containing protein [Fibrobacterota bacterium]
MNLTDDGTSLILYNNIIKNRTDSKYLTNVFGVGLIDSGYNSASDPLFLNSSNPFGTDNIPGTSDDGLLLTVNSPCIDRGTANNMPQKDLIGTLRPQGNAPDIGAYEYASFAVTTIEKLNDNYSNDYIISPNPFNPNVTVYSLKENASSMSIYNSLGKMVITLNSIRDKSNICFKWDGKNSAGKKMPSGIYFARIKTSSRTDAIKLFLSR